MNCNLPEITYPTLRTLLLVKLCEVIYLQTDVAVKKVSTIVSENDFEWSKINLLLKSTPPKRVRNSPFTIVYQSAIALKLSSVLRRNSLELAYQILDQFQQKNVNFCQDEPKAAESILSDFTGKVFSPGLLQFELGDRGLSVWLQCLMKPSLQAHSSESIPLLTSLKKPFVQALENSEPLFVCQHSHARCCSLLRLAHDSVMTLNRLEIDALGNPWMILTPDPIPWLTAQGQLCLTHPAERALISQLVTIVDESHLLTNPRSCLKSALALSHAFQTFYRACQIFELASPSSLQRSQSRLGLVMATQRLLRHLLEVGLNAKAPLDL